MYFYGTFSCFLSKRATFSFWPRSFVPGDLLGVGLLGLASMTRMARWSVRAEVWGTMLLTIGRGQGVIAGATRVNSQKIDFQRGMEC